MRAESPPPAGLLAASATAAEATHTAPHRAERESRAAQVDGARPAHAHARVRQLRHIHGRAHGRRGPQPNDDARRRHHGGFAGLSQARGILIDARPSWPRRRVSPPYLGG